MNCVSRKYVLLCALLLVSRISYFVVLHIITGSIARSASLPVFNLLRGRF